MIARNGGGNERSPPGVEAASRGAGIAVHGGTAAANLWRLASGEKRGVAEERRSEGIRSTPVPCVPKPLFADRKNKSPSLNFSHFVAHKTWRRCGVSPLHGRPHRPQRRKPLRGLIVPIDT